MAIRKSNPLGKISGTYGKTVTRIRNGKEVVYVLPGKIKASQSKAAKAGRKKFGLSVSFAKFVNSVPALSAVWSYANISGTNAYQKLIKHNARLTGADSLTVKNIITPKGIPLKLQDFSFNNGTFYFSVNTPDNNITDDKLFPARIYSVLYFYDPKNKKRKSFEFHLLTQEIEELSSSHNLEFHLSLNSLQSKAAGLYNKCIIYSAILFPKAKDGNLVWSGTIAKQVELN